MTCVSLLLHSNRINLIYRCLSCSRYTCIIPISCISPTAKLNTREMLQLLLFVRVTFTSTCCCYCCCAFTSYTYTCSVLSLFFFQLLRTKVVYSSLSLSLSLSSPLALPPPVVVVDLFICFGCWETVEVETTFPHGNNWTTECEPASTGLILFHFLFFFSFSWPSGPFISHSTFSRLLKQQQQVASESRSPAVDSHSQLPTRYATSSIFDPNHTAPQFCAFLSELSKLHQHEEKKE